MRYIIDRMSDGIAVLEREDLSHAEVNRSRLPENAHEGSVLEFDGENYVLNVDTEQQRRARIIEKQRRLRGNKHKK